MGNNRAHQSWNNGYMVVAIREVFPEYSNDIDKLMSIANDLVIREKKPKEFRGKLKYRGLEDYEVKIVLDNLKAQNEIRLNIDDPPEEFLKCLRELEKKVYALR